MMLAQFQAPEMMLEMHKALATAGKFMWPIPDKGLKKRIHRIKVPTLLLWGESDKLIPPVYGEAFLKAIPGSRLVVLKETAHIPMLERQETFVRVIRDFLKE